MISLDDPKWQMLSGGYRLPYDASVRLRELDAGSNNTAEIWGEFWNELHHQGDVGIASYATVPQLVRICIKREILDWNVFALVAAVEDCRVSGKNPQLPQWLEEDYYLSIKQLAEFGARHLSKEWSNELTQSFLAVTAFAKGLPKTGRALITLSEDEFEKALEKYFS
ncbi:MAG: hypothetical protein ABSD57_12555 [Verrucomicrobiota bacterium]|jgi:hypothetical protein